MLDLHQVIISVIIAAMVTFCTRAAPFVLYSRRQPPQAVLFIQRYIPPMTMVILVIYCVRDIDWAVYPHGLPMLIGIGATFILHVWRNNVMLSIFGATALYMFLIRMM